LNIINDYKKVKQINNIGFVSSICGDDWYNTTILLDQLKDLPFNFELGEISGIVPREGQLEIYRKGLDAVYRYYPLDWFDKDEYYSGVIDAMKEGTLSINPPSTIITQSKAFMALIYELRNNNFFSHSECNFIDTYIPRTYLAPKKSFNGIFCAKPFFEREGNSVAFSFKEPGLSKEIADYVFQEWVDIQGVSLDINSTIGTSKEIVYPVLGAYLIDNQFGGIYTRAGNRVTNKWAVYLPTYIENA
jgi:glutathionylspermidine synthase